MAEAVLLDPDPDDPPSPFALQRGPDTELEAFARTCRRRLSVCRVSRSSPPRASACSRQARQWRSSSAERSFRRVIVAIAPGLSQPLEIEAPELLDLVPERGPAAHAAGPPSLSERMRDPGFLVDGLVLMAFSSDAARAAPRAPSQ